MFRLQSGDILLYSGKGFFSWVIKLKTGKKYSHCEIYLQDNYSIASRDGKGVGLYRTRYEDLVAVLRPIGHVDLEAGMAWFWKEAFGQKYDWIGLFNFWIAKWQGRENRRMFCSEFVVRWFREAHHALFPQEVDADGVSPGDLKLSTRVKLHTFEEEKT